MRKSCVVASLFLLVAVSVSAGANELKGGELLVDSGRFAQLNRMRVFHQVWSAVDEYYYDKEFKGIDWRGIRAEYRREALAAREEPQFYRVLNQMLGELRDGHTTVYSPAEMKRERRQQRLGLGITSEIVDNKVVLTQVAKGSAAEAAGVQPGWIMTHFDGEPVDLKRLLRPAIGAGRQIRFRFLDPLNRERELELEARPFPTEADRAFRQLKDGTVYVRIDGFERGIGKWFQQVIASNRAAPACVVDLRGNPGGFFGEMRECLEPLFEGPALFGESIERSGKRVRLQVPGAGAEAYQGRVIVLIDRRSYSAAEVFAAAIHDSKRGELVGRTSGGIALLALHKKLSDGGEVSVSFRDYLRRGGERIEGRGVPPNVTVPKRLDDLRRNVDRDLAEALAMVQGRLLAQ